jgi:hypothetical protein
VTGPDRDDGGELPALTPEIVADDVDLAAVVDRFMFENVAARDQQGEILQHQEVLRIMLEPEQWQAALQLEEATTARSADLAVGIARWAFHEGQRFPVLPEGLP